VSRTATLATALYILGWKGVSTTSLGNHRGLMLTTGAHPLPARPARPSRASSAITPRENLFGRCTEP